MHRPLGTSMTDVPVPGAAWLAASRSRLLRRGWGGARA